MNTLSNEAIALFGLIRPIILVGILMVQGLGTAIALGSGFTLRLDAVLWGLLALFFTAASVNLINEYADHETDALTTKTRYSGGSGVLPKQLVSRRFVLLSGWLFAILGMSLAFIGADRGLYHLNAVWILFIGTLGGWMYSLNPLKLAWRGGAEIANGVLGGLILPLYGYAVLAGDQGDYVRVLWACLPYALLVVTTAMATTYPDRAADVQVGKRTWATWLDASQLRQIYLAISVLSVILLFILTYQWILPAQVLATSLVIIPAIGLGYHAYTRQANPHPSARAGMMMVFAQTAAWVWLGIV